MTSRIHTFLGIVFVLTCGLSSVGEVVVDFHPDSSVVSVRKHQVLDYEFANMDSRSKQQLVMIENGFAGQLQYAVTISQILNETREVLWRGQDLPTLAYNMLVGNIDDDEQDEVVLYQMEHDEINPHTARVIEFESNRYQETLYSSLAGSYGALIDMDNDSKYEVVVTVRVGPVLFDDALEPSGIRLYSFDDGQFNLIGKLDLEHTVRCLTVGDVDADGIPEIVTQEASNDGEILHQISVYDVFRTGEITHQFSKNRVLTFSTFPTRVREMRVFTGSDSNTYIATYRGRNWLSRVHLDNGVYDINEIEADFELRTEAVRHRLPFNGEFYGLIESRKPQLFLFEPEKLGEAVQRINRL